MVYAGRSPSCCGKAMKAHRWMGSFGARRTLTCPRYFGPIFAGNFQFSGMCDSGRWTREDHEEIEVYGGADRLHPAAGRGRASVGEICRKAGISEATYYNWRKKYVGLMPSEMKRLRQLERERQAEEDRGRPVT